MKKILIPVLDAGSGHRKPAEAVAEAIERLFPEKYRVDIVDPGGERRLLTDLFLKKVWDLALAIPLIAHCGYFLVELSISKYYLHTVFWGLKKYGVDYIYKYQPDIVFSTHFFWLSISEMARRKHGMSNRVGGFLIDPHLLWCEKGADFLGYDDKILKNLNLFRGMDPARLKKMNFPVHIKFSKILGQDKSLLKKKYGLLPDTMTVLASQGGQGIGKIHRYIKSVYKLGIPVNILYVCGNNTFARNKIEQLKSQRTSATNLISFGYVENMEELIYITDVVLGKGGPSTTFEALSLNKPMIYANWATFTEKPLIEYITGQQAGWYAPSVGKFTELLGQLVKDPQMMIERQNNCSNLGFKSGADDIAKLIDSFAESV